MLPRKGPIDLVGFVRSQGGMRDEAGELTAAGLSNTARKGDDFTQAETLLGPVTDNEEGASIDDIAQRAWSEGYFPELDRSSEERCEGYDCDCTCSVRCPASHKNKKTDI